LHRSNIRIVVHSIYKTEEEILQNGTPESVLATVTPTAHRESHTDTLHNATTPTATGR
jgi:hypothetical protein